MKDFFFDLPVYRLPEQEYIAWFRNKQERYISEALGGATFEPAEVHLRESFQKRYGEWRYNEIVGYIRLYFWGSQVRGSYHTCLAGKRVLQRKKVFINKYLKLAPDMDFTHPLSSASILQTIQTYIKACRLELPSKLVVDDELFRQLAPHVDWLGLVHALRAPPMSEA